MSNSPIINGFANEANNSNFLINNPLFANETLKKTVNVASTFFIYSGLKLLVILSVAGPVVLALNTCEFILNQGKKCRDKIQGKEKVVLFLETDDFLRNFPSHLKSETLFSDWPLRSRYYFFKYTVKNFKDIKKAFSDLKGKQIAVLVIKAHGDPLGICLSKEKNRRVNLNVRNASEFKPQLEQLTPAGIIILHAGSVGATSVSMCIAKKIANLAPGRKVFAPTKECAAVHGYNADSGEPEFYEPEKGGFFYFILNTTPNHIFNALPLVPKLGKTITACYIRQKVS